MKLYIYILVLLVCCSCSVVKKSALKVKAEVHTEEVKQLIEEQHQAMSIDTSKVINEEWSVTEERIDTSEAVPITVKRVINYHRTTAQKGATEVNSDNAKELSKAVSIDSKAVVSKAETTKAKSTFPIMDCLTALAIPLLAFLALLVIFIAEQRKNKGE